MNITLTKSNSTRLRLHTAHTHTHARIHYYYHFNNCGTWNWNCIFGAHSNLSVRVVDTTTFCLYVHCTFGLCVKKSHKFPPLNCNLTSWLLSLALHCPHFPSLYLAAFLPFVAAMCERHSKCDVFDLKMQIAFINHLNSEYLHQLRHAACSTCHRK